jgi:hypothetical protein
VTPYICALAQMDMCTRARSARYPRYPRATLGVVARAHNPERYQ